MLLLQAIIIFYSIASARSESSVVQAMRDYVPIGNPYSRPFHYWGAVMTGLFAASMLFHGWIMAVLAILWYWLIFDIALNLFIGNKWSYLGSTSKIDRFLTDHYEGDAGIYKAAFVSALIIILNLCL